VEQMAVYKCKQLGDDKVYNATCCDSIYGSPTLAHIREVQECHNAVKQHLVNSICGMQKGDLEVSMLKQRTTVDITLLNRYQVPAQLACPPPASTAPKVRRNSQHWYLALGSCFGSQHQVFLLSLTLISP
jgi:hypothetical protein